MPFNDPGFLLKLLATFQVEGEEHISAISAGLVELEHATSKDRRMEIVETVFREAHSLKGAARAVNLGKVEGICQTLETAFAEMKGKGAVTSPELFDRLHQMVASVEAEIAATNRGADGEPARRLPERSQPGSPEIAIGRELAALQKQVELTESVAAPPRQEEKAVLPDTVRVSSAKLGTILRQAEELIASKATAAHRAGELRAMHDWVGSWAKDWTRVQPQLRALQRPHEHHGGNGQPNGSEQPTGEIAVLLSFLDRNASFLQTTASGLAALQTALDSDRRALDRRVADLLDEIKRASMVPFSVLLAGFPKAVRDLSRDCGKDIELVIRGGEIEASRKILDEIKDPLMHLLRNCVDHGIGTAAERERKGKPARGTISIDISPRSGGRVEVVVADDGAGIDTGKVAATAAQQGLVSADLAAKMDHRQVLALIFQSGFSTSPMVTSVSGRGLGLAIVREKVEGLGGQISVESAPGLGTTFRVVLPLAIATFRGILVRAGEHLFVLPTMCVQRALRVNQEEIKSVENRPAVVLNGRAVSSAWLTDVLGIGGRPTGADAKRKWPGLLLEWSGEQIVVLVDEVLRDQEVLVKGLGKPLLRVRNIAGATVMESGKVVPVLNVPDLMRSAAGMAPAPVAREPAERPKSILVVEDSITARTLLKSILESAGYAVTTAVNGAEAFGLLENAAVDIVISDVEMPRMNGFDLTAKIRGDRRWKDLPVVLVTGLDSREDRERGADVGANAYIVKSGFDQSNLLEVVQRLI